MQLEIHGAEVYCTKFSPCHHYLASAGHDRLVQVWDIQNNCTNLGACKGHKNAVLDLKWSATDSQSIYTASADKTAIMWDTYDFSRVRTYRGHESHVNSIDISGAEQVATGSNDCTLKLWDNRVRKHTSSFNVGYQVTAVAHAGKQVFFAGVDNTVRSVNLQKGQLELCLVGHADMVTSLALPSVQNGFLLSNAMDNTCMVWDIKPYCESEQRMHRCFVGATHNFEKNLLKCCWSPDGTQISAGSADRTVNVWDF